MHELILWTGFLGAWLLVLGPLYQAILELREEDIEQDRIRDSMAQVPPAEPVPAWWLLLPPVWWVKHNQARRDFQSQLMAHLTDEDYDAFSSFMNKARGWLFVSLGGLLIATKETWELVEDNEWPVWLFWLLVVIGLGVAVGHAALSSHLEQRGRDERERLRKTG